MDFEKLISKYIGGIFLLFIITVSATNVQVYDSPVDIQPGGEQRCQPLYSPVCNINSYLTVQPFYNTLNHTSLESAIAEMHKFAYLTSNNNCKSKIQLFLCALYAPVCVNYTNDRLLLPCRDDCEEAEAVCTFEFRNVPFHWPKDWDCTRFNYHKDDKLCVIDTTIRERQPVSIAHPPTTSFDNTLQPPMHSNDSMQVNPPHLPPERDSIGPEDKENMCAEDLFDCQLKDPLRNMNAFCIDPKWVCNGKKDCVIDGIEGPGSGLDEVNCEKRCDDGQLFCDERCISRFDICNGKVDCVSGIDEQDCYDYLTGTIQSILCIIALLSAMYLLIKFFNNDDQEPQDSMTEKGEQPNQIVNQPTEERENTEDREHVKPQRDLEAEHQSSSRSKGEGRDVIFQYSPPEIPIYQEPTYSITTRSDYERYNWGGCSGASSVYAYNMYHPPSVLEEPREPRELRILGEPPAAPPPTPAPQQIYSTGSMTKLTDLYVNIRHKKDLLD